MDYRVHGVLQARILEWVAVPSPEESSHPRDRTQVFPIAGGLKNPAEPPGKPKQERWAGAKLSRAWSATIRSLVGELHGQR